MSKKRQKGEPVAAATPDLAVERLEQLRELFPDAFSEGKVDLEKLRAALGDIVDDRPERYAFIWAGKRDAIRLLQTPSRATLIPCPDESVDFDTTQNLFIEGDNLEVLKLLYKSYAGRVKMIYIDPPYNTGHDFIYPDNFADPLDTYLKLTGQKDGNGNLLTSNPETSGRFHSSWLSMVYPRVFIGRQLLREDGFFVVSIDDAELHNAKAVLNEVFGEENFLAALVWDRNRKNDAKFFSVGHEYMLVYARNQQYLRANDYALRASKEGVDEVRAEFERLRSQFEDDWEKVAGGLRAFCASIPADDPRKPLARFNKADSRGPYRDDRDISWPGGGGPRYDVLHPVTGKPCKVPRRGWVFPSRERMQEEIDRQNVAFGDDEKTVPSLKSYLFDNHTQVMRSVLYSYAQTAAQQFDSIFDGVRVFDNPKSFQDMSQIVEYLSGPEDLILDFFAGSCSTAHGVIHANKSRGSRRRFLCVQLPEPVNKNTNTGKNAAAAGLDSIAEIGKERIRRVIKQMTKEAKGKLDLKDRDQPEDLGFRVFKLAESHMRRWTGTEGRDPKEWTEQMELFIDPLLPGWQAINVIQEVALREGYSLAARIEQLPAKEVKTNTVYRVSDGGREQSFLICLDKELKAATPKALGLKKDDIFVCRDVALTDELAANIALQCRLKTI